MSAARRVIGERRAGRVMLDGVDTLMLGSNDYLGLSTDPRVLAATTEALGHYGAGTCLYPVFATTPLHEALCENLAAYLGTEAATLFSSGGSANSGVLTTLVEAGDVILSDRLNHASIIDGCRSSRADILPYANRDVTDLRAALEKTTAARRRLIVTDGIFSMEGAAAPLREIYALALEYDALLIIDEAHALGVVGPDGTGTAPLLGLRNDASGVVLTGSLSKALGGASGGFVAGSRAVIDRLEKDSRSWIFTMGMTTANAATALAALKICRTDAGPRERLWANLHHLREAFRQHGVPCLESDSAITAVPIGDEGRARRVAASLLVSGIYAPAIAYPVVARGEARLRIQVSAAHEPSELDAAARALALALTD